MNTKSYRRCMATLALALMVGCAEGTHRADQATQQMSNTTLRFRGAPGVTLADLERANRRIAELESQLATKDAESARLRSTITDLERQVAQRDQELSALSVAAGGAAGLAGQLSAATGDLDRSRRLVADLEAQIAEQERKLADLNVRLKGAASPDELAKARQQTAGLQASLASREEELARVTARTAGMVGADEAEQAKRRSAELERQLADLQKQLTERDRELAALRGDLSVQMARLQEAQRGIGKALRKEVEKGTILVDLRQDHLLVNLASSFLFGSGEDQLKPAGVDALTAVGAILKEYPEYQVEVAGHTDNVAIKGELAKRFPTNKELSEARAVSALSALRAGGLTNSVTTGGYASKRPVASNATAEGRQKNRRVEVIISPKR